MLAKKVRCPYCRCEFKESIENYDRAEIEEEEDSGSEFWKVFLNCPGCGDTVRTETSFDDIYRRLLALEAKVVK